MALSVKSGQFSCPAATGNTVVSGLGFAPKAIIFFTSGLTADGLSGTHYTFALGFSTGVGAEHSVSARTQDGVTTTVAARAGTDAYQLLVVQYSTGIWIMFYLASYDADGFTVTWYAVSSGVDIHYLAIGGASLSAKVGSFTGKAGTGTQPIASLGFVPQALMLASGAVSVASTDSQATIALGVATSTAQRWAIGNSSRTGLSTSITRHLQSSSFIYDEIEPTATIQGDQADFSSFDADGFTINWANDIDNRLTHYLALRGVSFKAGTLDQPGSTGNQVISGLGFTPKAIILASVASATLDALTAQAKIAFGVATAIDQRCVSAADKDAVTTTVGIANQSTTKVISLDDVGAGSGTTLADASLSSLDTDGFTLNWSTVDATARKVHWFAIGEVSAAVGWFPPPRRQLRRSPLVRM